MVPAQDGIVLSYAPGPPTGAKSENPPRLLHHFFERQALARPEGLAVCCGTKHLTYAALDSQANRLARLLRNRGIGPGHLVGLLLPRSADAYAAMLAVLKAGAGYVPIDPEYPAARIQSILADCRASLVLSTAELAAHATGFSSITVLIEELEELLSQIPSAPLPASETRVTPEDLCYVIYTSGTTGRPKGVAIEHRSISHLVETERRLFALRPQDRVFQGFSIAFDASLEEIWLAFAAGAALLVGTAEIVRSGPALSQILAELGVTVLSCVPTLLSTMEQDVPCLRLLILGGEICPDELVRRWWNPQRRIVNTYGPTEATVVATYSECAPDRPVTIGRALPGYEAVIVDENLQLIRPGQEGELALGGIGLARGYVGRPELTARQFVHLSIGAGPARRFYRTGDRARWTSNGELQFLGRIDTQVKIRGFRVELSEIEAVLLECGCVTATAVSVRKDDSGPERLVAYVVPRAGERVDPQELRDRLRQRLPEYMVPACFEILRSLPTLPSGKVDRHALPSPSGQAPPREVLPPRSRLEQSIVNVCTRIFSAPTVSILDNFFLDLGGHSLLVARMVSELRRLPEFRGLSVADVYRHPTAERLASEIKVREPSSEWSGFAATDDLAEQRPSEWRVGDQDPRDASHHLGGANPGTASRQVPFWRHFACGLAQLVSLVFVLGFFALQWLAPYLTYTVLIEEDYEVVPAIRCALASLVLLYPLMLLLVIATKWVIIGRYKSGSYPLWGWYYFRFWLVTSIEATVPVSYLSGTPLLSIYLRLMGGRIGRGVLLQTDNFAIYDLLSIGDNSSVNADANLLGYEVRDGHLHLGAIALGERCFVGARATLGYNSSMADGAMLEELSLLPNGQNIGPAQIWSGSPAMARSVGEQHGVPDAATAPEPGAARLKSRARACGFVVLHGIGLLLFPALVVAALFPGIVLMNRLNYIDPYYWYLLLAPLVGTSFVGLLCLEIVALKWLVLGRIRPGRHPLQSWCYLRKWFVDKTLELSLDVLGPLYASVYLSPWYRLLGAKVGKGAEISTASFISPDLLTIGEESFIADNVSLGAPRIRDGFIEIGANSIGRRSFIGNSALLPPATIIGDEVLIGCLSVPPRDPADALRHDSAWLGSPALFLTQRLKTTGVGEEARFDPPVRLRVLRAVIEFVRVISPSTGFIILTSLLFSALLLLHDQFSLAHTLLFFPLLYLCCGSAAAGCTVAVKWLVVGRYQPGEKPLWSTFVWRNELVNALHEHLAGPFLIGALTGTPFIAWYLRLLGARIGRRTYIETTDFSEFDLARIGDDAALNADCTVQTHLFEDRIMKTGVVNIGRGCTVGAGSLVLYETQMECGSTLGPLSLLMKGETLPAQTRWAGIPARGQPDPTRQRITPAAQDCRSVSLNHGKLSLNHGKH